MVSVHELQVINGLWIALSKFFKDGSFTCMSRRVRKQNTKCTDSRTVSFTILGHICHQASACYSSESCTKRNNSDGG